MCFNKVRNRIQLILGKKSFNLKVKFRCISISANQNNFFSKILASKSFTTVCAAVFLNTLYAYLRRKPEENVKTDNLLLYVNYEIFNLL